MEGRGGGLKIEKKTCRRQSKGTSRKEIERIEGVNVTCAFE